MEFTAVMATILTRNRVVPALANGHGRVTEAGDDRDEEDKAKVELERLIGESQASLAVNFTTPDEVCLRLVER